MSFIFRGNSTSICLKPESNEITRIMFSSQRVLFTKSNSTLQAFWWQIKKKKKRRVREVSTEQQLPPPGCPPGVWPRGVRRPLEMGAPIDRMPPQTGSPLPSLRAKTDSEMPTRDPTVHIQGGPATNHRHGATAPSLKLTLIATHYIYTLLKTTGWGSSYTCHPLPQELSSAWGEASGTPCRLGEGPRGALLPP